MKSTHEINSLIAEEKTSTNSSPAKLQAAHNKDAGQEAKLLSDFYHTLPIDAKVLVVIGAGTAALTYLYTKNIEAEYSHIVILGDRGYWNNARHRLAQPHHIFALPHSNSDEFINPAEYDEENKLSPSMPGSAYVHSHDYQERLSELEKTTLEKLIKEGKKVFLAPNTLVKKINQVGENSFSLETKQDAVITANKIVVATGAGPERTLPKEISVCPEVKQKILTYTDVLTPTAEQCRGKDILIYGGGATAAWAMEVADLTAKPIAWVSRSGFQLAISAGPRVNAIIKQSESVQISGTIERISSIPDSKPGEKKLLITIVSPDKDPRKTKGFVVDYLFNCIGQEPYELGGLPELISSDIQKELIPYLDKNYVTGTEQKSMLGWTSKNESFIIIGAAQGTYYNQNSPIQRPQSVSSFLPISGQVPITIGGVVSSVCALTDYMPLTQNVTTGKTTLLSLNVHVMNATQLATYFTACYPDASPTEVNNAVTALISERTQTDFGLSKKQLSILLDTYFGAYAQIPEDLFKKGLLPTRKNTANSSPKFFKSESTVLSSIEAPQLSMTEAPILTI